MKWVFLAGLLAFIPLLTALLKSQPKYLLHACFAMGLLPFFLDPYFNVAPISWSMWRGPVKGIEVTLIDAIAVAILLSTSRARVPAALKLAFAVYIAGIVISTFAGQLMMPAMFYGWQLLRAVIVFLAIARATAAIPGAPMALVAGLGTGIFIECGLAMRQFASGGKAGGNLGHQNMLGLSSHFAVLPAFALLLASQRVWQAAAVVLAGGIIAVVGSSRATIGLYFIGLAITMFLSIRHKSTGRKTAFAAAAVVALAVSSPAMMWSLSQRTNQDSSNFERQAMNEAARMIIADFPLGVGGSQYVVVANTGGYLARVGAAWNAGNRGASVHNSYLLVAAELGVVGLIGMLATLGALIGLGLRAIKRSFGGERSELLVGLVSALIVVCAHIGYEWLFMHYFIHYLLAMNGGAIVGIVIAERRKQARARQSQFTRQPVATYVAQST